MLAYETEAVATEADTKAFSVETEAKTKTFSLYRIEPLSMTFSDPNPVSRSQYSLKANILQMCIRSTPCLVLG